MQQPTSYSADSSILAVIILLTHACGPPQKSAETEHASIAKAPAPNFVEAPDGVGNVTRSL